MCLICLSLTFTLALLLAMSALEGDQSPVVRDQMGEERCAGGLIVPASVSVAGRGTKGLRVLGEEVGMCISVLA